MEINKVDALSFIKELGTVVQSENDLVEFTDEELEAIATAVASATKETLMNSEWQPIDDVETDEAAKKMIKQIRNKIQQKPEGVSGPKKTWNNIKESLGVRKNSSGLARDIKLINDPLKRIRAKVQGDRNYLDR